MILATLHFVSQQPVSGSPSVVTSWVELLTIFSIIALGVGAWHHVNCHEPKCWRVSWHKDTDGHPKCKKHHPEHPSEGVLRNILKRLGLRKPTPGPVRFHYRKPPD